MLKLEAAMPGFGGVFIDSTGEVVAWVKQGGTLAPNVVRNLLSAKYATHHNRNVRELMAPAVRARIQEAAYTLAELIAIENRIAHSPARIKGYAGVGTSIYLNRVKVGFRDAGDVEEGVAAIVSTGVPQGAIVPEVWGESHLSGTWFDYYRPTRGGLKTVLKDLNVAGVSTIGSHGYNVRGSDGQDYFLLSAHQANMLLGVNGATGHTLYQPIIDAFTAIAFVSVNPAWQTGSSCNTNPATGNPYDFCTRADAALATFIGGGVASGERKIGTSVTEGNNGQPGSAAINNWYPINGTLDPNFVLYNRNIVHKSGHATGTTTGFIDLPCAQYPVTVAWASPFVLKTLELQCHARVSFAGWGHGDSGGPVFARQVSGGPYFALGTVAGGSGTTSNGVCNAGQACSFWFAAWSEIEYRLGRTLNPSTTIP